MKIKFFENVETLEELRKQYKKLVFKHHPNKGGKTENMQQVNAEYEYLIKIVGNKRKAANGETYTKNDYNFNDDKFKEIINKIINFDITIEICGSWIWIENGYSYKEKLKKLDFFWCSSKKRWAWSDQPSESKYHLTMDEIRNIHGSEIIKNRKNSAAFTLSAARA